MTPSLDTSGWVDNGTLTPTTWSDLSPFEQGYVEAMLRSLGEAVIRRNQMDERDEFDHARFSDLHPETLAVIRKDCAAFQNIALGLGNTKLGAVHGERFWRGRNDGSLRTTAFFAAFPPRTPSLDDGKVRFA